MVEGYKEFERRQSDKEKTRTIVALLILCASTNILACYLAFKALSAMSAFNEFVDAAVETIKPKQEWKESF